MTSYLIILGVTISARAVKLTMIAMDAANPPLRNPSAMIIFLIVCWRSARASGPLLHASLLRRPIMVQLINTGTKPSTARKPFVPAAPLVRARRRVFPAAVVEVPRPAQVSPPEQFLEMVDAANRRAQPPVAYKSAVDVK